MRRHASNAFTLIELLVVISIIALLMALMLPALSSAQDQGKMARNISNLRQIQISLNLYANDNKNSLPHSRWDSGYYGNLANSYWSQKLLVNQYLADPFIFWSPFRNTGWFDATRTAIALSPLSYSNVYYNTGYGVNSTGAMPSTADMFNYGIRPRRLGELSAPTLTASSNRAPPEANLMTIVECFEIAVFTPAQAYKDGSYMAECPLSAGGASYNIYTYRGAATRAYLDGHVLSTSSENLKYRATDSRTGTWIVNGSSFRAEPWYSMK